MNDCFIKNITPELIFEAYGNSGAGFSFDNPYIIPEEPLCILSMQENSNIQIFSESGESLLIYC